MKRSIVLALLLALLAGAALAAIPLASSWGARAAAADRDRSLAEMLRYAIEDEYLARAEYAAIIAGYGPMTPFSNIIRSEESHIAWLTEAHAAAGLALPKDEAASLAVLPPSLKAAFEAGVAAEVDNIAMYDSFLASPLLAGPGAAATRDLFTRLRDASKNHLESFRRGLARF